MSTETCCCLSVGSLRVANHACLGVDSIERDRSELFFDTSGLHAKWSNAFSIFLEPDPTRVLSNAFSSLLGVDPARVREFFKTRANRSTISSSSSGYNASISSSIALPLEVLILLRRASNPYGIPNWVEKRERRGGAGKVVSVQEKSQSETHKLVVVTQKGNNLVISDVLGDVRQDFVEIWEQNSVVRTVSDWVVEGKRSGESAPQF